MLLSTAVTKYWKLYITLNCRQQCTWEPRWSWNVYHLPITLCEAHAEPLKQSYLIVRTIQCHGWRLSPVGFSSSHVWIWELDCEEGWALKNWCFWAVVLEKTPESPLDCKEIQVHSKGDQPWHFFGRNDGKAETPVLWPPHAKSWLIGKDFDAGRDWRQEEKGTAEDEMAGLHHWLDGHESEWTPGVGDGQGGLSCCDSWCRKESDTTERLNWTELNRLQISKLGLRKVKLSSRSQGH